MDEKDLEIFCCRCKTNTICFRCKRCCKYKPSSIRLEDPGGLNDGDELICPACDDEDLEILCCECKTSIRIGDPRGLNAYHGYEVICDGCCLRHKKEVYQWV